MTFSAQLMNYYYYFWGLAKCGGSCGSGSKYHRLCHRSQGSLARRLSFGGYYEEEGLRCAFSDSDLLPPVLPVLPC